MRRNADLPARGTRRRRGARESGGWFFYAWTELDVRPWPWLRAVAVAERTRLFETAREFILGPLVGFRVWKVDFSFYWFQPGGIDQTFAAKLEVSL